MRKLAEGGSGERGIGVVEVHIIPPWGRNDKCRVT